MRFDNSLILYVHRFPPTHLDLADGGSLQRSHAQTTLNTPEGDGPVNTSARASVWTWHVEMCGRGQASRSTQMIMISCLNSCRCEPLLWQRGKGLKEWTVPRKAPAIKKVVPCGTNGFNIWSICCFQYVLFFFFPFEIFFDEHGGTLSSWPAQVDRCQAQSRGHRWRTGQLSVFPLRSISSTTRDAPADTKTIPLDPS